MKNIALIGFMGAGKSTVAALLARELDATLVEIDNEVVRLSELDNVNVIFDKKGEIYFRELEQEAIKEAVKNNNCVISCGGGVVNSIENMEILKANAFVVFLHASFDAIKSRLKNTDTRPLFRQEEKAILLYAQRLPLYQKFADTIIDTDDAKPERIVKLILKKYRLANDN
ncbi:MAG: shikimate kinase [Bacteroidia bacterium]